MMACCAAYVNVPCLVTCMLCVLAVPLLLRLGLMLANIICRPPKMSDIVSDKSK